MLSSHKSWHWHLIYIGHYWFRNWIWIGTNEARAMTHYNRHDNTIVSHLIHKHNRMNFITMTTNFEQILSLRAARVFFIHLRELLMKNVKLVAPFIFIQTQRTLNNLKRWCEWQTLDITLNTELFADYVLRNWICSSSIFYVQSIF